VVFPTGVSATGAVGQVLVWGKIVPVPTGPWTPVNDSQTPNWTVIAA
jgi:hypothetical protein